MRQVDKNMLVSTVNGFQVQGIVSFDNVALLRRAGEQWMQQHASLNSFVIDLLQMKEQDASVLSLLLSWQRIAIKNNWSFSLTNVSTSLQRMAAMFGLTSIIFNG